MNRKLTTYGNYFIEFYSGLDKKVQTKIDYVFELVKSLDLIPKRFFKYLEGTDGIFEIRIEFESNIYRIFCFFDEGYLVILMNGFQKKSQKTPKQEIELAEKLKRQYFIDKKIDIENGKRGKV
ncbi:type II toxin-antitoxin system RelE/ParE family toxin [Lacihabitans sp. LS3-19]|uniref:type II toxin-antitoxin system RelE/ParE family toxin n=1 Tax=Lacihabitans sp. LS3-19 TaxID=2487335 RepID=UPI0020CE29E7|nr:type II toxin-antitoxin system RelE/ParE family toxin [Lacihabitans sp. LS3-19]MCP9769598.1 type II toxin-antitoxin system RelE/ParE family toxin [Lacihabitans sp. LS3-19]